MTFITTRSAFLALGVATALAASQSAWAHNHQKAPGDTAAQAASSPAVAAVKDMAEAEIRKIDMDTKKITLKHGEIKNLDMPPMTMVFQVADDKLLSAAKTGDKIKFTAEKIRGAYTVTAIEVVAK
jgi:Cu(I)/Ag(I) efflux system periplasmic protein CusF